MALNVRSSYRKLKHRRSENKHDKSALRFYIGRRNLLIENWVVTAKSTWWTLCKCSPANLIRKKKRFLTYIINVWHSHTPHILYFRFILISRSHWQITSIHLLSSLLSTPSPPPPTLNLLHRPLLPLNSTIQIVSNNINNACFAYAIRLHRHNRNI